MLAFESSYRCTNCDDLKRGSPYEVCEVCDKPLCDKQCSDNHALTHVDYVSK